MDIQFGRKTASGEPNGSRVFGDCDIFLREIMKHIFSTKELDVWENARGKRIKKYDKLRETT